MSMPERKYFVQVQRYGFNGQEKSDEISAEGNHTTAEFWEFDARIGRRWNIDLIPKTSLSSYSVLGNDPIMFVDPNGADWYKNKNGETKYYAGTGKHKGWTNVTGSWQDAQDGGKVYYGHGIDDKTFEGANSEMQEVTVSAKTKKWKTVSWLDGSQSLNNLDLTSNAMIYGQVTEGKLPLSEALKNLSFAYDLKHDLAGLQLHYKAEQEYKQLSYGAVGMLTAPLAMMGGIESGAASYLLLGTEASLKARASVVVFDAAYQLATTGTWNPVQSVSSQFGPLSYALGSSTYFNWQNAANFKNPIGVKPNLTIRHVAVMTMFNIAGTHAGGVFDANGAAAGAGIISGLPSIWADGTNELLDQKRK